jgi:ActR/RegA family two-component response regulator
MKMRLLFVDDEEGIRITLPAILRLEGFEVIVAGTVPEALDLMQREQFDILLTDLNIGEPGDGFTIVSAMRRIQPSAVTFILTGYPDFQSALEAIRRQVDDYLTKPADIRKLVGMIKDKLAHPRHIRTSPSKRAAAVIHENLDHIIESWIAETAATEELMSVPLTDQQRADHLCWILQGLVKALETEGTGPAPELLATAATKHGEERAKQGYDVPMLVRETAILHQVLSRVLHECQLEIDPSTLVGDAMKIGENLNCLLEQSVRSFQKNIHQKVA